MEEKIVIATFSHRTDVIVPPSLGPFTEAGGNNQS